jgi:NAD(P)-dependent dehydrogenase (short-subunit alcohol dehydrogenase family)
MKVALVIGGSGMLAGATLALAKSYDVVGVVGRNVAKLDKLRDSSSRIVPIAIDYSDTAHFRAVLGNFVEENGNPELVISWVHDHTPEATLIAATHCTGDFYDVTGQAGSKPEHISHEHESVLSQKVRYHRVILAHKGSRWLTNKEISDGVLEAVNQGSKQYVIGEL